MFTEYNEYFETLQDKSENTVRSYRKAIDSFLSFCKVETLEDLKTVDAKMIRVYQTSLRDSGMKNSSVNANLRPVSAFLIGCANRIIWKKARESPSEQARISKSFKNRIAAYSPARP